MGIEKGTGRNNYTFRLLFMLLVMIPL